MQVVWVTLYTYACYDIDVTIYITCENHPPSPLSTPAGWSTIKIVIGSCCVWDRNMEFRRGRGNEWFVIGVSADKPDDESCYEPFFLEMACELVGATKQKEGVKVL